MPPSGSDFLWPLVAKAVVVVIALTSVPVMVWLERKASARMQNRYGPLYVGPCGWLQPLVDAAKILLKEDFTPARADRLLFLLAPLMAFVPALFTFAVIPMSPEAQIADINIGVLFVFAVSSLGVYGIVMAGWASNNKYALLGGLRSSAQMISYEISLALSVIGVLIYAQSLSLREIVLRQAESGWFVVPQFLGFILFLVAAFAETNRLPFDLPEAESELVAGFHVEYASMRFALFFMAEYIAMLSAACLIVILFFGGWLPPPLVGPPVEALGQWLWPWGAAHLLPLAWFLLKVGFFMFLYVWVRWTFPRLRYDQLMALGWKVLLPLAIANVFVAGVLRLLKVT